MIHSKCLLFGQFVVFQKYDRSVNIMKIVPSFENKTRENRVFFSRSFSSFFFLSLVKICDRRSWADIQREKNWCFKHFLFFFLPCPARLFYSNFFFMIHHKLCLLWVLRCTVFRLLNLTFQYKYQNWTEISVVFVADSSFVWYCTSLVSKSHQIMFICCGFLLLIEH